MPLDLKTLMREHGIAIEMNGARGVGLPLSPEIMAGINPEDARSNKGHVFRVGGMITALVETDANGEAKRDANGRPVRTGGYVKMLADLDLTILVPREDQKGEFTRVSARNTREAAAALIRMENDAKNEVEKIAKDHAAAMDAHQEMIARGEQAEEPVARTPRHLPAVFAKYANFVSAAEAAISSEVRNGFATDSDRRRELMASLAISNARRNILTHEELARVAEERTLREQISKLNPDHPDALRNVSGSYTGNGKASADFVQKLAERSGVHMSRGVPAFGDAATLLGPLMSTFTTEKPGGIYLTRFTSTGQRARFEQEIEHFENPEIAEAVAGRVTAIMRERMPDYACEIRFFSHEGADVMMMADKEGAYAYLADTAARTTTLDIEAINRVPTKEDVPSDERLEVLRATVAELRIDNDADVEFDDIFGGDVDVIEEEDDLDDEDPDDENDGPDF